MMNCIAVDDEKLVLDLLVDNIQKISFLKLVARCRHALEAAEVLHKEPVDLIFLDIQMPGLSGLQFLQTLNTPPMVVFITAYKEYAVEGFDLNAVDYLVKPVSFERFLKACNKAQELHTLQKQSSRKDELPDYFFVYVEYNQVKISVSEILYIEGMKDYVKIFLTTSARPVITRMNLKAIEDKLIARRFVRIHRSYIISLDKIAAIKRDVVMIGKTELPVGESYRSGLSNSLPL